MRPCLEADEGEGGVDLGDDLLLGEAAAAEAEGDVAADGRHHHLADTRTRGCGGVGDRVTAGRAGAGLLCELLGEEEARPRGKPARLVVRVLGDVAARGEDAEAAGGRADLPRADAQERGLPAWGVIGDAV